MLPERPKRRDAIGNPFGFEAKIADVVVRERSNGGTKQRPRYGERFGLLRRPLNPLHRRADDYVLPLLPRCLRECAIEIAEEEHLLRIAPADPNGECRGVVFQRSGPWRESSCITRAANFSGGGGPKNPEKMFIGCEA